MMGNNRFGSLTFASRAVIPLAILGMAPAALGQVAPGSNAATVPPSSGQPAQCAGSANAPATSDCDDIFGTMLEYQKAQAKEKREDQSFANKQKQLSTATKARKLKTDNESIVKSMEESRAKADSLLQPQNNSSAASPNAVVDVTMPAVVDGKLADPCRLPDAACPEPCKLPPCQ